MRRANRMWNVGRNSRPALAVAWLAVASLVFAPPLAGNCLCTDNAAVSAVAASHADSGQAASRATCCSAVKRAVAMQRSCCQSSAKQACGCQDCSRPGANGQRHAFACSCHSHPAPLQSAPPAVSSCDQLAGQTLATPSADVLSHADPRGMRPLDDRSPTSSLERCILLSRFVI
jgi:hypothetical protein